MLGWTQAGAYLQPREGQKVYFGFMQTTLISKGISWIVIAFSISLSLAAQNVSTSPGFDAGNPSNEARLRGQLSANPHDQAAFKAICDLVEKRGDLRGLGEERLNWLESNPEDYFVLMELNTTAEIQLNDPEFAINVTKRFLSKLKSTDLNYGVVNNQYGNKLVNRGRVREAIPFLEAATKANADEATFRVDLAKALFLNGRVDAAIEAIRKAIELDPSDSRFHASLGNVLAAKHDVVGQETEYKASCQMEKKSNRTTSEFFHLPDPLKNTERCMDLAKLQLDRGEYDEAEATLQGILNTDHFELSAYLVRAQMLEARNKMADAKAQRDKAQLIFAEQMRKENFSPDSSAPLMMFAKDDPRELARILEPLKDRLTVIDRRVLAAAYFGLGRSKEAVVQFEKSFGDPKFDTAQAHFGFGEALKGAKLFQKAEDQYRKAYEMDPENVTYRYEFEKLHNFLRNQK